MNTDLATQLEADIDQALARGELDQAEALASRYVAGSPAFRARYLAARVALEAGRLGEARRRLAGLLPLPADLPDALACRVWLMFAEALARLGQHALARGYLVWAQYHPEALRQQPLLKLREVRIRLWLGERDTLGVDLAGLRQALESLGDREPLALLLCEEGRALDAAGEPDRAEECWRRAAGLLPAGGPDAVRADVLMQLGRLAHLRGRLQEALDRCDEAAACAAVEAQRQEAALRRVLLLLDLDQATQARRLLEGVLAGPAPLAEEVRPLARMAAALVRGDDLPGEARAYAAARRGEVEQARALYQAEIARAAGPHRQARLALALGMLALAVGEGAEARRWLDRAVADARRLDLPEVLWRGLQAQGQLAAEVDGDDEQARRLFEEAVLVSEQVARTLSHRADAARHGLRRADVLRRLVSAACRRGDAAAVFRYQELERGRLLLELWRAAPSARARVRLADRQDLEALEKEIAHGGDSERLLLERDRLLDEHLRDRSRATAAALPELPELEELARILKPGTLYAAGVIAGEELYLLVCPAGGPARLVRAGSATAVAGQAEGFRRCLAEQMERYRLGLPVGRAEIDDRLEELGTGPLGEALWPVLDEVGPRSVRLIWAPDGVLHGLPVHALRRGGRYLVERHEVVFTFGGSLLYHQTLHPGPARRLGPAVVVSEAAQVLPCADREARGVAAAFWRSRRLAGPAASRQALRRRLARAKVVHLACHAYFDPVHPLSASVALPSGEAWRALDWLDEPLDGLPLVTLSACRSAEVGPLLGREVFGLVTGLLGSGVRAVVAGLWPVADREACPLMHAFYRHRLTADLPAAQALAQREALAADGSPLFWAAFALFGDADALPPPRGPARWLARWRQARHAQRFPRNAPSPHPGV